MTNEDDRLRARFAELRRSDEQRTPAFRTIWGRAAAVARDRAGTHRPMRVVVGAAAVALCAALALALRPRPPAPFPPLRFTVGAALPLDGLLTLTDAGTALGVPELGSGAGSWGTLDGDVTWDRW